jgi:hypothetical protein
MNVVHISNSPVAGSPGNIVSALNRLTDIRARHIVFNSSAYRTRTFAVDIDWKTGREEALDAIAAADVIHIHQFFSLDETFGPDFQSRFGKKKLIRQYHSAPDLWAKGDAAMVASMVHEAMPQLVIAQGPERYYPFARVVPNIIPIHDERYLPMEPADGLPIVAFSPSGRASAWKTRWETKGAPQTLALLRKLQREGLCKLQLIVDTPYDECLRARQQAAIVIDECVTGNYHQSGLEALSQGKPTVGHLDQRVQAQIRQITGATELPWIDMRLEEAEQPLRELLASRSLRASLGTSSRKRMETYYDDAKLIQHFRQAYLDLFDAPDLFGQARFDSESDHWLAVRLPNHHWTARRNARAPLGRALKTLGGWIGIR